MNLKKSTIAGYILLGGTLAFSLYGIGNSLASGDYEYLQRGSYDHGSDDDSNYRHPSMNPSPMYKEECGSCHIAYPAELLPPGSWQKMMTGLDDHFGESAELDDQSRLAIETYLMESSQSVDYRRMLRNLGDQLPIRITQLPYFIHEHNEIPAKFIEGNDNVGSLSQCNACHRYAEQGDFDEDNIVIPGVGRWDD